MPVSIVTICGSVRPGNNTGKALGLVIDELGRHPDVEVTPIDLASVDLAPPGRPAGAASVKAFQAAVRDATGVVIATPEYHGSFSSIVKLAVENLGFPSALAGKPIALVGVAAGQIGAIKSLEHLRSVCSHVGGLVLPSLASVANVRQVFDEQGRPLDPAAEKRLRGVATALLDYIRGAVCPRITLEAMLRGEDAATS